MLRASGAPAERAAINTDSGGKNGRIALQIQGKNLKKKNLLWEAAPFKKILMLTNWSELKYSITYLEVNPM